MKHPEVITLTVNPDGTIQVAVAGVAGPACAALTAAVISQLGETKHTTHTPEYLQRVTGPAITNAVRQS